MSAFLAIQTGLRGALIAAPALAGGNVQLNRFRPIPESQSSALVLRLDQTGGQETVLGVLDWVSSYSVECYARAAGGADPAQAVDALLADVWARLAVLDAAGIGAQQLTLTPQIDWQYDDAATALVCAVIRLTVTHSTTTETLAPRA